MSSSSPTEIKFLIKEDFQMKKAIKFLSCIMVLTIIFTTTLFTVGAQEADLSEEGADAEIAGTGAVTISADRVVSYFKGRVGQAYDNGYCLRFVADSWKALGAERSSACCAYNYGSSHIQSTSINNVPIGADVFFGQSSSTCSTCKSNAGHIGVYVGNGEFVHASGGKVQISSLSSWSGRFRGWGYHTGVVIDNTIVPPDPVPNHSPVSHSDLVVGNCGSVTIVGWTFDPDSSSGAPNMVHAYAKAEGSSETVFLGGFYANAVNRPDVCQAYPECHGSLHGYCAELQTTLTGNVTIYLYGINLDGTLGENVCFCETTVNIQAADPTPPDFKSCKIASHETTTFRLSCVPANDSQTERVFAAIWTLASEMSDLKWVDMVRLSNGEWIYDVKRED